MNRQRGFGALAAIVVLVAMAALAAAIVRVGAGAQQVSAAGVLGARASQAARAGTEWGLYQAYKGSWTTCAGASQTLDLRATLGMAVTVTCTSQSFTEGLDPATGTGRAVRVYRIDAVACNSAACPDNAAATGANYVERQRQVLATD